MTDDEKQEHLEAVERSAKLQGAFIQTLLNELGGWMALPVEKVLETLKHDINFRMIATSDGFIRIETVKPEEQTILVNPSNERRKVVN